MKLGASCPTW